MNFQTGTITKVPPLFDTLGLGLTAGPDGTIYFGSGGKILKVNPAAGGGVRTVAGTGMGGLPGDGGLATLANINTYYLAVNPLNDDIAIADQSDRYLSGYQRGDGHHSDRGRDPPFRGRQRSRGAGGIERGRNV